MRISSQMFKTSFINMQNSEVYKSYVKKNNEEDQDGDSKVEDNIKHVTQNIFVEKKDDQYILSRVNKDETKTIINEFKANSKHGLELSKFFDKDETDLKHALSQINSSINSNNLSNYL